jgi:hypothetical protein
MSECSKHIVFHSRPSAFLYLHSRLCPTMAVRVQASIVGAGKAPDAFVATYALPHFEQTLAPVHPLLQGSPALQIWQRNLVSGSARSGTAREWNHALTCGHSDAGGVATVSRAPLRNGKKGLPRTSI